MRRTGVAAIHVVLWLLLVIGLMALSFWAGTTVETWPSGPMEDDNSKLAVYGYVAVEPRHSSQLLLTAQNETQDYSGLEIEQRTQAGLLQTRALLASVISSPQLQLRDTNWFKSFKNPTKARQWLEKHFHAEPIKDSKLIRVWLDPIDSQKEARTIVTDIVNTHLEQQRQSAQGKALDRAQALTSLKTKYEIRIRELSDRQNNLLLRMQVGGMGTNERYTTTDLELKDAIARRAAAADAVVAAQSEHDRRVAEKPEVDASVKQAKATMHAAQAVLDAVNKRVDQLKGVLGDLSIAMADYLATQDELKQVRQSWKDVRDQLDTLSAQSASMTVDWAQRPAPQGDD